MAYRVVKRPMKLAGRVRMPLLSAAILAMSASVYSADVHAFRCGNKLVTEGMHVTKVIAICGEPAYEQERIVLRRNVFIGRTTREPDSGVIRRHVYAWGTPPLIEVEIRELTWNLGPNKFMRRVRFEDGIVTGIETLERGFIE